MSYKQTKKEWIADCVGTLSEYFDDENESRLACEGLYNDGDAADEEGYNVAWRYLRESRPHGIDDDEDDQIYEERDED